MKAYLLDSKPLGSMPENFSIISVIVNVLLLLLLLP